MLRQAGTAPRERRRQRSDDLGGVHDLRANVKGFVQAQNWFQDLTPVYVDRASGRPTRRVS